jgi:hypothetical protein
MADLSSAQFTTNASLIVNQLSTLKDDEIKQLSIFLARLSVQPNSPKGFLIDQRGNKSSKRYWAFAFGWITIIQVVSFVLLIFLSSALGWQEVQKTLIPLVTYSLATTGTLTALCLGLTLPEWFAPKL